MPQKLKLKKKIFDRGVFKESIIENQISMIIWKKSIRKINWSIIRNFGLIDFWLEPLIQISPALQLSTWARLVLHKNDDCHKHKERFGKHFFVVWRKVFNLLQFHKEDSPFTCSVSSIEERAVLTMSVYLEFLSKPIRLSVNRQYTRRSRFCFFFWFILAGPATQILPVWCRPQIPLYTPSPSTNFANY